MKYYFRKYYHPATELILHVQLLHEIFTALQLTITNRLNNNMSYNKCCYISNNKCLIILYKKVQCTSLKDIAR